ncbi:small-conductance mechanosensitive channel [Desulfocapsa sulfexigens DSM 10523]|uniref:Small-conductance mechanosensitive channel n=1 Tax=Desulfocapsa sulfexigens (strain DSM 10523 / SB164P1) TaxID=1167006 RepID=M1P654_DESSD|nr:mechanosensitive ion channel domain-containing protein [Desulfocapsa sulfexigens]AGF77172.1 small-conductance mechanosensitive channel [Desulfocapsa sulfexigens DSM 10523]
MKNNWFTSLFQNLKLSSTTVELLAYMLIAFAVILTAIITTLIVRKTLLKFLTNWIQSNNYRWDDPLAKNKLLSKISWFVPVTVFSLAIDMFLDQGATSYLPAKRLITASFVIVSVLSLTALLSSANDIHRIVRKNKGASLRSYIDAGKILTYVLGAIFLISIFTGKSPWGILSVLGGLTAVTMLVFKDSILGFVASIQINSTDMVRLGDWVEIPQYGADGDVVDISIHSIRVQNWDKTISTIPTYALVSNSFKNWRGMSESGGRRIKRALNIDIHSIRFCDEQMLDKLSNFSLIADYIRNKQQEIEEYNLHHNYDQNLTISGRRQTNVGIFRAYVIAYLRNNTKLHQEMTFLVRQLAPTEHGLPLEIYVFSKDQAWANYEAIQADIFDHLLAAIPEFGLRIFQNPSGYDFRCLGNKDTSA